MAADDSSVNESYRKHMMAGQSLGDEVPAAALFGVTIWVQAGSKSFQEGTAFGRAEPLDT